MNQSSRPGHHTPTLAYDPTSSAKRTRRRSLDTHQRPSSIGATAGTWREHVPAAVLEDAERRTRRCATALRSPLVPFCAGCGTDHIITSTDGKLTAGNEIPLPPSDSIFHQVTRTRFNSTDNSKRFVSNFLFWKLACGIQFPVTDTLLKNSWKCINSCDYGIK